MESNSIPYFPLMCQLDDKFELIEAEFGLKGFAVVVKLYQKIYGAEGYYCEWTKEVELLFARRACGFTAGDNFVSEIIQSALKRGLFSQNLFDKYHILTSHGIQKNYFEAIKRRTNVKVKKEYLLVKVAQIPKNVDIISENAYKNEKNARNNSQRREEERREEERREEESNSCFEQEQSFSKPLPIINLALNDKTEYPIFQEDIQEWEILYPAVDIVQELRKMKGWLDSNPSRRKTKRGIKRFINSWLSQEQDKGRATYGELRRNTGNASNDKETRSKKYGIEL